MYVHSVCSSSLYMYFALDGGFAHSCEILLTLLAGCPDVFYCNDELQH